MCGVFGFISYDGQGPNIKRLEIIARVTMRRGPHAFGFAWLDHQGRLRMFKRTGRIVDHLGLLAMAADAKMLVGHCRYATHGDPSNNLNNHPHPADGGWIVHNGMLGDYRGIIKREKLHPNTDCDSEVLGLLIDQGEGSLADRCVAAVHQADGDPLVMLGLWSRPGRLIAVRAGNPLSVGVCNEGRRFYLGSLDEGLPGTVAEVDNWSAMEFNPRGLDTIECGSAGAA